MTFEQEMMKRIERLKAEGKMPTFQQWLAALIPTLVEERRRQRLVKPRYRKGQTHFEWSGSDRNGA